MFIHFIVNSITPFSQDRDVENLTVKCRHCHHDGARPFQWSLYISYFKNRCVRRENMRTNFKSCATGSVPWRAGQFQTSAWTEPVPWEACQPMPMSRKYSQHRTQCETQSLSGNKNLSNTRSFCALLMRKPVCNSLIPGTVDVDRCLGNWSTEYNRSMSSFNNRWPDQFGWDGFDRLHKRRTA